MKFVIFIKLLCGISNYVNFVKWPKSCEENSIPYNELKCLIWPIYDSRIVNVEVPIPPTITLLIPSLSYHCLLWRGNKQYIIFLTSSTSRIFTQMLKVLYLLNFNFIHSCYNRFVYV